MDIRDIDKNFLQNTSFDRDKVAFYEVTEAPFELYGVFYDEREERFLRIPKDVAVSVGQGVDYLNRHTSGGRVRFSTDSTTFTLIVEYGGLEVMSHMAISGCCGFALCQNVGEEELFYKGAYPSLKDQERFVWQVPLRGSGMREYTLHFPLYQGVKKVYVGLDKGASVGKGKPYRKEKPILYYGSSITQGGCASRADTSYPAFICKRNNVDFVNLGFSGNAKAEEKMIDHLAGIDCSVFVFDYDYNAPDAEYLQKTHYPAYKRYREKKPDVPVLFISKPDEPTEDYTAKRAEIVKASYERAKAEGDERVYYIDGRTLFEKEWQNCTVDSCHPTDFGFYQMSLKIGQKLEEIFKNLK